MQAIERSQYARALYSTHGDRAEAEAAQRARLCEEQGRRREARDWKAIRRTIMELRGPRQK